MNFSRRKSEKAFATLIVLLMISFMLAYVMANSNALFGLKREVKLVEQQQKRRWAEMSGTNATNVIQRSRVEEKK